MQFQDMWSQPEQGNIGTAKQVISANLSREICYCTEGMQQPNGQFHQPAHIIDISSILGTIEGRKRKGKKKKKTRGR